MEKYEKARMEVIEFDAEDVITTSGGCGADLSFCASKAPDDGNDDMF
ncbi:MAG: hypothetical protein ACI4MG_03615 [Aristaeellaceae bacterium]